MAISAEEIFRTTTLTREESREVAEAIDGDYRLEILALALIKAGFYASSEIAARLRSLKVMLK